MEPKHKKIMLLLDIDGTLTPSRGVYFTVISFKQKINAEMSKFLHDLINYGVGISFVGGSDFIKLKEQLGEECNATDQREFKQC